jgi:hypothetical protein
VRSTAQRLGWTWKPRWPGSLRTMSSSRPRIWAVQSTKRPTKPWSAQIFCTLGWSSLVHSSGRRAPSRSWTLAATTCTARSRPRVSVTMNRLRPFTFLPASKPLVAADGICGTDGLGVDQPGSRSGIPAVGLANLAAQGIVDALDGTVVVPPGEVPVDGGPGREVLRQLPPGAPGPDHVEDRVHDPPPRMLLPSPALRSHPRRWQQRLDQSPLLIRQIRRIPTPRTTHAGAQRPLPPQDTADLKRGLREFSPSEPLEGCGEHFVCWTRCVSTS